MRFGQNGLDLFVGHAVARLARLAKQPQDQTARCIEKPDQRCSHLGQQCHGRRYTACNRFRLTQCDLLWHEFADNQRQIGDDHDHRTDANSIGKGWRQALPKKPARQTGTQRRAGKCTRQNADQRDADLDGGQETAGIIGKLDGHAGAAAALVGHYPQSRWAGGNHCEFRHGENTIEDRQQHDRNYFKVQNCPSGSDNRNIMIERNRPSFQRPRHKILRYCRNCSTYVLSSRQQKLPFLFFPVNDSRCR